MPTPAVTRRFPDLVVWLAASASVVASATVLLAPGSARILAGLAGVVLALVLLTVYVRRATPLSAVIATVAAAAISAAVLQHLSGTSLAEGFSVSQAGGADKPNAWLLTSTAWCLGVGLLSTGLLVGRAGSRSSRLSDLGYRVVVALSLVPFLGFLIVGVVQVGGDRRLFVIHNLAAFAAMVPFWIGLAWSTRSRAVSRPLRIYSAVAAALIMITWLPTASRFLGFSEWILIDTLYMETLAFALSFTWLGWLAHEWGLAARSPTGAPARVPKRRTAARAGPSPSPPPR